MTPQDPGNSIGGYAVGSVDATPRRQRRRLGWRRAATAVSLLAALGAVGVGSGEVLAAVAGHTGAEHGHHEQRDNDAGMVYRPLPRPLAPPVTGQ